jgi:C4-dicarboxylate-specific signal transduction histidine kinase
MATSPGTSKEEEGQPSRPHGDLSQASTALVHELTEPLTAIQNYLEAAICLHQTDTRAASARLGEVFEKSQDALARASEILGQLRDLLRHGTEAGDPS